MGLFHRCVSGAGSHPYGGGVAIGTGLAAAAPYLGAVTAGTLLKGAAAGAAVGTGYYGYQAGTSFGQTSWSASNMTQNWNWNQAGVYTAGGALAGASAAWLTGAFVAGATTSTVSPLLASQLGFTGTVMSGAIGGGTYAAVNDMSLQVGLTGRWNPTQTLYAGAQGAVYGGATAGTLYGLSRLGSAVAGRYNAWRSAPKTVLSGKVTVKPNKWDYFFGRVKSSPHNQARSLQNLRDLKTLGFEDTAAGRTGLNRLFEIGRHLPETARHTTQYGTTITRTVPAGSRGVIEVKYFYRGGDLTAVPEVSTIIPKVFK